MPKKQNLEELLKKAPSPTITHKKIITLLFAFLIFFILIYLGSITYTGITVMEFNQPSGNIIKNQNIFVSNRFEVLEIEKASNSVLDINLDSDLYLNIFAEIDDCFYWKDGKDRDNTVWYALNGIKQGNFKIGDPSEKTIQQVDLYKTNNLCLIFINRDFPKTGNAKIQYQEIDINKWRIA
jgi:hypothetical protein